ncbi:hypothetical protein BKA70DRAFT_1216201 [Coprinopsis sp. MPI-PUGE-AT-0042]|nr:hypothetical protein BKA70DRAFT_1216201 [Coprinopsis sp. MPI-PUGE-AT-0042]
MRYTSLHSIDSCFQDSVNSVAFSPNAKYIASICEDGWVFVHTLGTSRLLGKSNLEQPATAIAWLPDSSAVLIGLVDGQIFCLFIDADLAGVKQSLTPPNTYHRPRIDVTQKLVVGFGCDVAVIHISGDRKLGMFGDYYYISPSVAPGHNTAGFEVRSLSILNDTNLLIAYLEAGVIACNMDSGEEVWRLTPRSFRIGRAAVDGSSRFLACTNLFDGMDIYDIHSGEHLQTVRLPIRVNVALPVRFIYEGSHVLLGSASGRVRIVSVPTGLLVDELEHGNDPNDVFIGDIVQAIDYTVKGTVHYVVTACSEKGPHTYIRIWQLDSGRLNQLEKEMKVGPHPEFALFATIATWKRHQDAAELEAAIQRQPLYRERLSLVPATHPPKAIGTLTPRTPSDSTEQRSSSQSAHCNDFPSPAANFSILNRETLARVEAQKIHDQLCQLTSQAIIHRPRDLTFSTPPSSRHRAEADIPYSYTCAFNTGVFQLILANAGNGLILHYDAQFLSLSTHVEHLLSQTADSPPLQTIYRTLHGEIVSSIALLHAWKKEIWIRQLTYVRQLSEHPGVPQELLPGFLLILVLKFIYHLPERPCTVVLAFMRTQMRLLRRYVGDIKYQDLVNRIPKTTSPIIQLFDLDPRVRRYASCPRCYALRPINKDDDYAADEWKQCGHRPTQDSAPCTEALVRKQKGETGLYRPLRVYLHQNIHDWLGRFLSQRKFEDFLDQQKLYYRSRPVPQSTAVTSIIDSQKLQTFKWPDGRPFYDCAQDEFRLFFGLSFDGFNPFGNREAKQTGVRYNQTSRRPRGALLLSALLPILADALGLRQVCGYGSVTSEWFCTCCYLPKSQLENVAKASWPKRIPEDHRYWAERWRTSDSRGQTAIFKAHGIRWTPLLKLEYWEPISNSPVDGMHNLLLGLIQYHCRSAFGMDSAVADGDGSFRPRGPAIPRTPPADTMEAGRIALETPGLEFLKECSRDTLFHLCFEKDLRRGGKRRDFVRELAKWRTQHKIINAPQPRSVLLNNARSLSSKFANIIPETYLKALCKERHIKVKPKRTNKTVVKDDYIRVLRAADKATAGQSTAQPQMVPSMLTHPHPGRNGSNEDNVLPKRGKVTVVLGKKTLLEVAKDRADTVLPSWVEPAPERAGSKGHGKLSADNWDALGTIHLPVTLIRLWARHPPESREYRMLLNFLDLVNAIEIANMFTTSPDLREQYDALMTRYLDTLKDLYPETPIVPNHHLALHISDYQELWGPSPEAQGWGWERYNHDLTLITTNHRWGAHKAFRRTQIDIHVLSEQKSESQGLNIRNSNGGLDHRNTASDRSCSQRRCQRDLYKPTRHWPTGPPAFPTLKAPVGTTRSSCRYAGSASEWRDGQSGLPSSRQAYKTNYPDIPPSIHHTLPRY